MSSLSATEKQVSDIGVFYIREARQIAVDANNIFVDCKPSFPCDHWNWREVPIGLLAFKVENVGKSNLGLSEDEFQALNERLNWAKVRGMERLSLNRFCLFIGEALKSRFDHRENTIPCRVSDATSIYLT